MYLYIFVSVVVFICGIFIGFYVSMTVKKINIPKWLKNIRFKFKLKSPKCKENSIQRRFTDTGEGYSDIVCDINDENQAEYVEKRRKRQNISYTYTNRK